MLINFDDYLKEIRAYIAIAKEGTRSNFIQKTTVVSLRKYCLYLFDEGLNNADEQNFRLFFQIKKDDDLRTGIQKFDADKFRPIKNFIDGKTENPSQVNIELIAILLDFNPRPFSKFSKSNLSENATIQKEEELKSFVETKNEVVARNDTEIAIKNESATYLSKNNLIRKVGIGSLVVLSFFGVKNTFFKEKECMQWQEDHYVRVECKSQKLGFSNYSEAVIPYDEIEFQRKKITVCDTTTFVRNEKPIIWYSKKNNVVDFFNMNGENPENGADLRKVTTHIIKTYVKPCK